MRWNDKTAKHSPLRCLQLLLSFPLWFVGYPYFTQLFFSLSGGEMDDTPLLGNG